MFRYDRGNLVLTDWEYKILNILRPRVAGEEKFLGMSITCLILWINISIIDYLFLKKFLTVTLVRETYPLELCKHELPDLNLEKVQSLLTSAKENDSLKKGGI